MWFWNTFPITLLIRERDFKILENMRPKGIFACRLRLIPNVKTRVLFHWAVIVQSAESVSMLYQMSRLVRVHDCSVLGLDFSLPHHSNQTGRCIQELPSSVIRWPECESDNLTLSSAEVKNAWIYICSRQYPMIFWHVLTHRDNVRTTTIRNALNTTKILQGQAPW